jgi:hypothetical protein
LLYTSTLHGQKWQNFAKKLANPIASLISVPFQNNSDYGIGDLNGSNLMADSIFSS